VLELVVRQQKAALVTAKQIQMIRQLIRQGQKRDAQRPSRLLD
jgi:hypothetical protein